MLAEPKQGPALTSSTSETAGADAGGAGVDAPGNALEVISVSPEDQATGVERDEVIEVAFSDLVDAATVTDESFKVEGPEGALHGKRSVSGANVTFTPDADFDLLGAYTISLSTSIHGAQAGSLEVVSVFDFQARDGEFRLPERIATSDAVNLAITGNRAGDVVAYWFTGYAAESNAEAVIFDPTTASWGTPISLENEDSVASSFPCVALNESGQAFATFWDGAAGGGWNRRLGAEWGLAQPSVVKQERRCALLDDGTAMTLWEQLVGEEWEVSAGEMLTNSQWLVPQTLQVKGRIGTLAGFGEGFMAVYLRESDEALLSNIFDPKTGWLGPTLISANSNNVASLETMGTSAMVSWIDKNNRLQASVLDGVNWAPAKDLGTVAGPKGSLGSNGGLLAWGNQGGVSLAFYNFTKGWSDSLKVAENPDGLPPTVAIDDRGNALVAWLDGRDIGWRRWVTSAQDWSDAVEFKDQDPTSYGILGSVDTEGNVMLVWQNASGVWASRFD